MKNIRRIFSNSRRKREASPPPDASELTQPSVPSQNPIINKGALNLREDLQIVNVAAIAEEILQLKRQLRQKDLQFTTWMGDFTSQNEDAEMGKLWENAWVLAYSGVKKGARVLDAGGASTIFSFYLASKGCEVSVIDTDWLEQGIIDNAVAVSSAMNWNMRIIGGDITRKLPYPEEYFDSVFCICVLEHLVSGDRRKAMRNMAACLKKDGIMGLTIDYDIDRGGDKGLRFANFDAIYNDLILPSGLQLYGNGSLVDDFDERFFLGALFLKKT